MGNPNDFTSKDGPVRILVGDATIRLKGLPDESIHMVCTSPPYWGLRSYLPQDHPDKDKELGQEKTPDAYVANLVAVFREVRRVLRSDGVCWLNLGDSYATTPTGNRGTKSGLNGADGKSYSTTLDKYVEAKKVRPAIPDGLKPKDLVGIPWRVAFALQSDGWYLRQDIIWCLSGGTWLYVRTQKGDMPMTVKDLARLDPATVKLWNGEKWTQLLGMNKSDRRGDELEIVLRSGERISCTPAHRFPTKRGLMDARDLQVGDTLTACRLPEHEAVKDCAIDEDAAWFAGLYVAEGSKSGDTIQISGHAKETERWERVQRIAANFGGTATMTVDGNKMNIRVYGKVLNAIIDELTTGRIAKNKGFAPVVWRYSNRFIEAMMDGYLSGDGWKDGDRWRLGFTRNYNLERDFRTACARLGWQLTLNPRTAKYDGRDVPIFHGEIRKQPSEHWNAKNRCEVVEIRKARCRNVYDFGVADEPHLFSLASGILTHNSKPNPMPESVTDRCTKAHEYVFLLAKSERYWYDAEAVKEAHTSHPERVGKPATSRGTYLSDNRALGRPQQSERMPEGGRNRRSVWTVATQPYSGAHFATFPPALIEPMILAGTSEKGCCPTCGGPWRRVVEKTDTPDVSAKGSKFDSGKTGARDGGDRTQAGERFVNRTTGWTPTCACPPAPPIPCTVLDPFIGSGTVGQVCERLGRNWIGIDLNPEYAPLQNQRTAQRGLAL